MVDFSINTIARGLLGLISLILISFLLSNNKKKNSMENRFNFNFNSICHCGFNLKSFINSINFWNNFKIFCSNNKLHSFRKFIFIFFFSRSAKIHLYIRFSSFTSDNFLFGFNISALPSGNSPKNSIFFSLDIE